MRLAASAALLTIAACCSVASADVVLPKGRIETFLKEQGIASPWYVSQSQMERGRWVISADYDKVQVLPDLCTTAERTFLVGRHTVGLYATETPASQTRYAFMTCEAATSWSDFKGVDGPVSVTRLAEDARLLSAFLDSKALSGPGWNAVIADDDDVRAFMKEATFRRLRNVDTSVSGVTKFGFWGPGPFTFGISIDRRSAIAELRVYLSGYIDISATPRR
jgi:hypothetical protein